MKVSVGILEKMGQTMSLKQLDSVSQMYESFNVEQHAFKLLQSKTTDLICILLPDDDDDSEE